MKDKWAMPQTPDEEERREQIKAARRMSNGGDIQAVRSLNKPRQHSPAKEARTTLLKGHMALIEALRANGTRVQVSMQNGDKFVGPVTHFDDASVTIQDKTGSALLFKSSISSFLMLTRAPSDKASDA